MSIAIKKEVKFDGARCPFSTFLCLQGDHHCSCAQKWCHFPCQTRQIWKETCSDRGCGDRRSIDGGGRERPPQVDRVVFFLSSSSSSNKFRFGFLALKVASQAFTWKISICLAKSITVFAAHLAESSLQGELACGPLFGVLHRSCSWLSLKTSALSSAGFVRRLVVWAEKFAQARNPTRYEGVMSLAYNFKGIWTL